VNKAILQVLSDVFNSPVYTMVNTIVLAIIFICMYFVEKFILHTHDLIQ
jgi:hypothetical protein